MRVLVVDHKTFLAELVKLALEADGQACFATTNVQEASKMLRSVPIDVVVLDLVLDGSNPLLWIEQIILEHPELQGRVFVLADRQLGHSEGARVRACGARVIRKPFTLQQMRETVRMMIPVEGSRPDARPLGPVLES